MATICPAAVEVSAMWPNDARNTILMISSFRSIALIKVICYSMVMLLFFLRWCCCWCCCCEQMKPNWQLDSFLFTVCPFVGHGCIGFITCKCWLTQSCDLSFDRGLTYVPCRIKNMLWAFVLISGPKLFTHFSNCLLGKLKKSLHCWVGLSWGRYMA